jgi:hypothetical protein
LLAQQRGDRVTQLRATLYPGLDLLAVELDLLRRGDRVVGPEVLERPAIAARVMVDRDHRIEGALLRAEARESNFDHSGDSEYVSRFRLG